MGKARHRARSGREGQAKGSTRGGVFVALLRGINVGGNKRVPMAELREVAAGIGARQVETYVQSGNLVLASDLPAEALEAALEDGIAQRFGFSVDVIVRTAAQWKRYADGSPFADAEAERPNMLHLALAKRRIAAGAGATLRERAAAGERIEVTGDAIWIDFRAGVARSKLTPVVLDSSRGVDGHRTQLSNGAEDRRDGEPSPVAGSLGEPAGGDASGRGGLAPRSSMETPCAAQPRSWPSS